MDYSKADKKSWRNPQGSWSSQGIYAETLWCIKTVERIRLVCVCVCVCVCGVVFKGQDSVHGMVRPSCLPVHLNRSRSQTSRRALPTSSKRRYILLYTCSHNASALTNSLLHPDTTDFIVDKIIFKRTCRIYVQPCFWHETTQIDSTISVRDKPRRDYRIKIIVESMGIRNGWNQGGSSI